MSAYETNKAISRRFFYELINDRRYDRIPDIFDPDIEITPMGLKGYGGVDHWLKHFHQSFSDCHDVILGQWTDGDQVATQIQYTGTHDGVWLGKPPTGQKVVWQGVAIHTIRDGRIWRKHAIIDQANVFRQLGWLSA